MITLSLRKDLPALTNLDLLNLVKELKIKHFRGVFMRDGLPEKSNNHEVGIVNLDSSTGTGTHWVCYKKIKDNNYYFDSFGLDPPKEIISYLKGNNKNKIKESPTDSVLLSKGTSESLLTQNPSELVNSIELSIFQIQKFNTHHCGYYCFLVLKMLENHDFKNTILSILR